MKSKAVYVGILFSLVIIYNSSAQQDEFPVLKGSYLGQKPPGITPELYMPGVISNCDLHSGVYFSSDGKEVYYSKFDGLMYIIFMKEENGRWTKPL